MLKICKITSKVNLKNFKPVYLQLVSWHIISVVLMCHKSGSLWLMNSSKVHHTPLKKGICTHLSGCLLLIQFRIPELTRDSAPSVSYPVQIICKTGERKALIFILSWYHCWQVFIRTSLQLVAVFVKVPPKSHSQRKSQGLQGSQHLNGRF